MPFDPTDDLDSFLEYHFASQMITERKWRIEGIRRLEILAKKNYVPAMHVIGVASYHAFKNKKKTKEERKRFFLQAQKYLTYAFRKGWVETNDFIVDHLMAEKWLNILYMPPFVFERTRL
jgi:hypothetical protein